MNVSSSDSLFESLPQLTNSDVSLLMLVCTLSISALFILVMTNNNSFKKVASIMMVSSAALLLVVFNGFHTDNLNRDEALQNSANNISSALKEKYGIELENLEVVVDKESNEAVLASGQYSAITTIGTRALVSIEVSKDRTDAAVYFNNVEIQVINQVANTSETETREFLGNFNWIPGNLLDKNVVGV